MRKRTMREIVLVSASIVTIFLAGTAMAGNDSSKTRPGPLELKEQGTFYVGGRIEHRDPNTSKTTAEASALPGDIAVGQMYVEYQIPQELKYKYPIVFMHGGGHTGAFFRTTPDGREGWFTSFTRRGFAVYNVDAPNRGRTGWDPTHRFAVSQGKEPYSALESANIYSAQSAWVAFRWGPTYGEPFPDSQFPLDYVNDYLKQIQPAYRDEVQNKLIQDDLSSLIDKIGPCILIGWSTGAGNVMVPASLRPDKVKGVITVEHYLLAGNDPEPAAMAKIPYLGIYGDYISPADEQAYTKNLSELGGDATTISLPEIGIHGNGHTMAIEKNSEQIADLIQDWIEHHAH